MDDEKAAGSGAGGPAAGGPPPGGGSLDLARASGLGLQFALSILLFLYLGRWVDGKAGTAPFFLVTGVFVGAGAAFYSMYRALVRPGGK